MRRVFFSIVLIFMVFSGNAQTEKIRDGHFVIKYDKDVEPYAIAGARILNFTWDRLDELGFKPPGKFEFRLVKSQRTLLGINTAKKLIVLEYTTLDPTKIRANNVFGLCHEMGHWCMLSITPTKKNNWMTKEYRESWADYFGISMAGLLYEKQGLDVWPIPYNYLAWHAETRAQVKDDDDKYGHFISAIFWEKLVNEKGMDKIPSFFRQLKSNKVKNPDADKKFRAELIQFGVSNDLLDYFDLNKQYLIDIIKK